MKKSVVILISALVISMGLTGCAARNTPEASQSPSASVSPYMTPGATPHTDVLPDTTLPNDAYEGGGAGGTNDPNGVFEDDRGSGAVNDGTTNNGIANNGTGHGNGVIGDVIDDVENGVRGATNRARTTAYRVAIDG